MMIMQQKGRLRIINSYNEHNNGVILSVDFIIELLFAKRKGELYNP